MRCAVTPQRMMHNQRMPPLRAERMKLRAKRIHLRTYTKSKPTRLVPNVASTLETQGTHARAHYSASTRPACQSYVCISLLWTMRAIQGAFVRDTCAAKAKQVSMRMR